MKTMKIMRRIMGGAAAILALTACSESEDLLAAYHSDSKAVHITAQVGKASADGFTRSNPLGTAEEQAKFNENDEISVKADGQDAVTYQFNGSEWQPQGNKFLKWESETMNFTAYYPASFNGNITQPTEYNKEADLAAADFMSFTGNVTNSGDNSLTLKMNRLMARVVVEIAGFNDQYTTDATVKSVTINGNIKAYKHSDNKFYALIKPCDAQNSETFLSLDVAEGESKTTTEKFTGIPKLEAGNSYTYKLTVGKNKVKVNGVTVADWTEGKIIPDDDKAKYTPYVTFTANGEQTFQMAVVTNKYESYTFPNLEYSVNNGEWASVVAGTEITFGGAHGDLRLRGTNNTKGTSSPFLNDNNSFDHSNIQFSTKNEVACKGDIRTLLDYKSYKTVNTNNARFYKLFADCTQLISAPELPATTLADNCYSAMFVRCSSLISAPKLPATTLANNCYCDMFNGCTNLTSAPELPATTLAAACYIHMFEDCTKLSTVTMLAPSDEIANKYNACLSWLYDAGTDASVSSRILKVQNAAAYKALVDKGYLPEIWKKGPAGATVLDENDKEINIE